MTRMATTAHLETAIIELEYERADLENAKDEASKPFKSSRTRHLLALAKAVAKLECAQQAAELAVALLCYDPREVGAWSERLETTIERCGPLRRQSQEHPYKSGA